MIRPAVSVCLSTFNGEKFLARQLESIVAQSVLPDEIVMADDGSDDGTADVVDAFEAHLPARIRLVRVPPSTEQLGVARNLERALTAATGEVVFLADQDDLWGPERTATALDVLEADPSAVLHASDALLVDVHGHLLGRTQFQAMRVRSPELEQLNSPDALRALLRRNVLPGMTFAVRRSLLERALPVAPEWPHDHYLAILAACFGGLRVTPDPGHLSYRQHGANVAGVRPRSALVRARNALSSPGEAARRARMYDTLAERLAVDDEAPAAALALIRQKAAFEKSRSEIPHSLPGRAAAVARLLGQGGYTTFGSAGLMTATQDLVREPSDQADPPAHGGGAYR